MKNNTASIEIHVARVATANVVKNVELWKTQLNTRKSSDAYNPSYIEMSVALKELHFDVDNDRMRELRMVWDEYSKLWMGLIRKGQERVSLMLR